MRRLVLLVFVLVFAAAGCGSGDDDSASGGDTTTTAVSECVDVEATDRTAWPAGGCILNRVLARSAEGTMENQIGGKNMGIIAFIILGLIAGAVAKALMPGDDPGGWIVTTIIISLNLFLLYQTFLGG